ncbi:Uncharacterized protein Rs2_45640 [Raphanus sativus]|nr:Uncharacterized protein Rs2_45640 [Raphanus sativus]
MELAQQIEEETVNFAHYLGLRVTFIVGVLKITQECEIVIFSSPCCLIDCLNRQSVVYGENYLYNKIYGPPIYDVHDDDDQIEYEIKDGQDHDKVNEVGLHGVEDVQVEQPKDVYGEEVANTINLVFGDKSFDTFFNDTCSYGVDKNNKWRVLKSSTEVSCDFVIPSKKSTFVICHMWRCT